MLKALRKYGKSREIKESGRKYQTGRKVKFEAEYLRNNGNAIEAAIKAGYSKAYASSSSYLLAKDINVTLARVARARGLNEHRCIGKYETLLDSRYEKIQLEAVRDLCEIIEPKQSSTTFGAAVGQGRDGRPTLQVVLEHSMGRPDRSRQAVKTFDLPPVVPTNGADHGDTD